MSAENDRLDAQAALKAMKEGKTVAGIGYSGLFSFNGGKVFFCCGDPNCCFWEETEENFLGSWKDFLFVIHA